MKILFDHQIFSSQSFGGISRYHIELAKHLESSWEIPVFFSNNIYWQELRKTQSFLPSCSFRGKARILERLNRFHTIAAVKQGAFDVFHPTFYATHALKYLKNKPLVFTVHDMIHDRFSGLPAAPWERREKFRMAQRATQIIVPSNFSADELMQLYHIPSSKIHVVHHGAPAWRLKRERVIRNQFLFVGGRKYYKNFPVVLQAMSLVPESTLLVVGAPFSSGEQALIRHWDLSDRVRTVCAAEEELPALYASSAAFIFSSRMEGFGLPVLEAFAAGCPTILSDIPVFREIAADTALYFDPDSADALAEAMKRILKENILFDFQKRLADFSWQKCADGTLAVYEAALRAAFA